MVQSPNTAGRGAAAELASAVLLRWSETAENDGSKLVNVAHPRYQRSLPGQSRGCSVMIPRAKWARKKRPTVFTDLFPNAGKVKISFVRSVEIERRRRHSEMADVHGGRPWRLAGVAGSAALLCAVLATRVWHASPNDWELESLSTPQTFSSKRGWSGATSTSLGDDSLFNELIERQLANSNVVGDVALPAAQEFLAPRPHGGTASLPANGDVSRMLSSGLSWPHAAGDSESQQTASSPRESREAQRDWKRDAVPPAHLAWRSPEIMGNLINEAPGSAPSIQWQEAASHSPATQQPTTTDADAGLIDTEARLSKLQTSIRLAESENRQMQRALALEKQEVEEAHPLAASAERPFQADVTAAQPSPVISESSGRSGRSEVSQDTSKPSLLESRAPEQKMRQLVSDITDKMQALDKGFDTIQALQAQGHEMSATADATEADIRSPETKDLFDRAEAILLAKAATAKAGLQWPRATLHVPALPVTQQHTTREAEARLRSKQQTRQTSSRFAAHENRHNQRALALGKQGGVPPRLLVALQSDVSDLAAAKSAKRRDKPAAAQPSPVPPLLSSIRKVKNSASLLWMPFESLASAQNDVSRGNKPFNKLVADNSTGRSSSRSFAPSRAGICIHTHTQTHTHIHTHTHTHTVANTHTHTHTHTH
jgi:hypothetical protein